MLYAQYEDFVLVSQPLYLTKKYYGHGKCGIPSISLFHSRFGKSAYTGCFKYSHDSSLTQPPCQLIARSGRVAISIVRLDGENGKYCLQEVSCRDAVSD
jgi:hypothetical protein